MTSSNLPAVEHTDTLKKTPLLAAHVRLGAKIVPFAGWEMPVQYVGIVDEHLTVRKSVGVFDISHMGQFLATGSGVLEWLNGLLAGNVAKLGDGQGQYSFLLNERGGVIDDLIVYRQAVDRFFLVVNASKIEEDWAWMNSKVTEGVILEDLSEFFAGLAVQGPDSQALYSKLVDAEQPLPPRNGIAEFTSGGTRIIICRTGYTGEDGFEFFCPVAAGEAWLERMLELGAKPCGLGARDTLRLEMCYPLNGNDLSPERSPLEAGLGFFVDLQKPNFIGREALLAQKENGLPSRLAAFRMTDKAPPPRSHYPVLAGGAVVGEVCSGGVSPSMGCGIGMAYLPTALATPGTALEIDIRGRRYPAVVEKKPLYKKP